MKVYTLFYVLLSILIFGCSLENSTEKITQKSIYKNYINPNYLKCLENELPCECYTDITSITIDSNYVSIFGGGIEPSGYPYEVRNDTLFTIQNNEYIGENNETIMVENEFIDYIILKSDSILFYNDDKEILLTTLEGNRYDSLDVYYFQHILNTDFLVKKINDKEFVDNLSINKNTSFSCNAMKGVNLLWNKPPQKTWVLEKENDSLVVYQDLTSPHLSHPVIVKKEFYKKYKW